MNIPKTLSRSARKYDFILAVSVLFILLNFSINYQEKLPYLIFSLTIVLTLGLIRYLLRLGERTWGKKAGRILAGNAMLIVAVLNLFVWALDKYSA